MIGVECFADRLPVRLAEVLDIDIVNFSAEVNGRAWVDSEGADFEGLDCHYDRE